MGHKSYVCISATFHTQLEQEPILTNDLILSNMIQWLTFYKQAHRESHVNSLCPGICGCDFKCVNLKHNFGIDILSIKANTAMDPDSNKGWPNVGEM